MLWDLVLSNRSFAMIIILIPCIIERIFDYAVVVTKSHRSKVADNTTKIIEAADSVIFVEFFILNKIIKIKSCHGKVNKHVLFFPTESDLFESLELKCKNRWRSEYLRFLSMLLKFTATCAFELILNYLSIKKVMEALLKTLETWFSFIK